MQKRPAAAQRFKTIHCRNYRAEVESGCPFGAECRFAHGEVERRTVTQNREQGLVSTTALLLHQMHQLAINDNDTATSDLIARVMAQQRQHAQATLQPTVSQPPPYGASAPCPPHTASASAACAPIGDPTPMAMPLQHALSTGQPVPQNVPTYFVGQPTSQQQSMGPQSMQVPQPMPVPQSMQVPQPMQVPQSMQVPMPMPVPQSMQVPMPMPVPQQPMSQQPMPQQFLPSPLPLPQQALFEPQMAQYVHLQQHMLLQPQPLPQQPMVQQPAPWQAVPQHTPSLQFVPPPQPLTHQFMPQQAPTFTHHLPQLPDPQPLYGMTGGASVYGPPLSSVGSQQSPYPSYAPPQPSTVTAPAPPHVAPQTLSEFSLVSSSEQPSTSVTATHCVSGVSAALGDAPAFYPSSHTAGSGTTAPSDAKPALHEHVRGERVSVLDAPMSVSSNGDATRSMQRPTHEEPKEPVRGAGDVGVTPSATAPPRKPLHVVKGAMDTDGELFNGPLIIESDEEDSDFHNAPNRETETRSSVGPNHTARLPYREGASGHSHLPLSKASAPVLSSTQCTVLSDPSDKKKLHPAPPGAYLSTTGTWLSVCSERATAPVGVTTSITLPRHKSAPDPVHTILPDTLD